MNLQENLEQIRKNSEQISWSGCGNCSRRNFYQTGYKDGLKKSEKELQELREYKNKVEKFISKNEHVISLVAVETVIDILKEELGYGDQL